MDTFKYKNIDVFDVLLLVNSYLVQIVVICVILSHICFRVSFGRFQ